MNLSMFYTTSWANKTGRILYVGQLDNGCRFALYQDGPLEDIQVIKDDWLHFPERIPTDVKAYFSVKNGKLNSWVSEATEEHNIVLYGKLPDAEIKFVKCWAVIRGDNVAGTFDRQQHAIAFAHSGDKIVICEGAYT